MVLGSSRGTFSVSQAQNPSIRAASPGSTVAGWRPLPRRFGAGGGLRPLSDGAGGTAWSVAAGPDGGTGSAGRGQVEAGAGSASGWPVPGSAS